MQRFWQLTALLVLILSLVVGCSANPSAQAIDPPPKEVEKRYEQASKEKTVMAEAKKLRNTMELYFLSNHGYVVPYALKLPAKKGIAREAMEYMVKGGPGEALIPKGFTGILPQGTKVLGIDIHQRTAIVDFSREFLRYPAEQEEKILSAITWTLTGFPSVDRVQLRVQGQTLDMMPKQKTAASDLTRNRGINVELSEGVSITRSMPVTLYFVGQTEENKTYHVPVTRLINRQDNVAQATVQELIKGPNHGTHLVGPLDSSIRLNSAKIKGQTAIVDFDAEVLQYGNKKAIAKDVSDALVLSLTENTPAKQVQVTVDGQTVGVSGVEERKQTPVARPKHINSISL